MNFKHLQQYSFLFLLAVVSVLFLWVIHSYIMPVFWAVVLAIVFFPLQRRLNKIIKLPSANSFITILFILIVIFVPLVFVGSLVFKESVTLYQQISTTAADGTVTVDLFEKFGESLSFLEGYGVSEAEAKEKVAFVRVGTLNNPNLCPPDIHIFTSSKQSWVELNESVPIVEEYYRRSAIWSEQSVKRYKRAIGV